MKILLLVVIALLCGCTNKTDCTVFEPSVDWYIKCRYKENNKRDFPTQYEFKRVNDKTIRVKEVY